MPVRLPSEQDMLPFKSLGVDYTKVAYERSLSQSSSGPHSPRQIPINRLPEAEKVAPPQITQNVRAMFETGQLPDIHQVKKMEIQINEERGAGVFENSPTPLEGVVRESDHENEEFKEGYTKELRSMWLNKENEQPQYKQRAPVKLAEDEGCILENEPQRREDVVREADNHEDPKQILAQGHAQNMRQKFMNGNDSQPKERAPIKLYDENDATPCVYENQPEAPRADVVRDAGEEGIRVQRGKAKNLKTFFMSQPEYQKENKPLDIAQDGGIVLENDPKQRADVVRESDMAESDKSIRFEAGRSRNLASMWQNRKEEYQPKQFKMDISGDEPSVLENEPEVREDVIRESHVLEQEVALGEGHARKLATRFLSQNDDDNRKGPKDMIKIERGCEPDVVENTPEERTDVVKCGYGDENDLTVESGHARGLVTKWLGTNDEVILAAKKQGTKPQWQIELEEAQRQKEQMGEEEEDEYDGIDPDDINDHQQIIPEQHTSSLRSHWLQMQEEEEARRRKDRCPEQVRFTPPREVTPPPLKTEGQKSYTAVKLNQPGQPAMNGTTENGYHNPTKTSKTVISLRST